MHTEASGCEVYQGRSTDSDRGICTRACARSWHSDRLGFAFYRRGGLDRKKFRMCHSIVECEYQVPAVWWMQNSASVLKAGFDDACTLSAASQWTERTQCAFRNQRVHAWLLGLKRRGPAEVPHRTKGSTLWNRTCMLQDFRHLGSITGDGYHTGPCTLQWSA